MQNIFDSPSRSESINEVKLRSNIQKYFLAVETGHFDANEYFSPFVKQYYRMTNTTPYSINKQRQLDAREHQNPSTAIDPASFEFGKNPDGSTFAIFKTKYHCYRRSMKKFEFCDVTQKFSFNEEGRITEIQELLHENLQFKE
jgi:hypothetical protein